MEKEVIPYSSWCFVCGQDNPAGLKRKFRFRDGYVYLEFCGCEHHQGYPGMVHGGILSALLDETMGWAPTVETKLFSFTAELNVRYLQPTPIHKKLIIIGKTESIHKRLYKASGEIRDEEGTVYVTAVGKYVPISPEETMKVDNLLIYDDETMNLFRENK